jgi:drug/metabolite transporter (DMT)-like permease
MRRAVRVEAWHRLPAALRGSLLMLASAVLFTVVGVIAKLLGERYDAFQVAFFRALGGAILTLPFLVRGGLGAFRTEQPVLQLVRTILASTAIAANFYALIHLPLADANAISFARALFLIPLAILILGEKVGPRRLGATLVGFVGVLIILRPSGEMEWAALVALYGALAVATASATVRLLLKTDGIMTLIFYSGVASTLVLAVPAFLVWQQPTLFDLAALMGLGALAVLSQGFFIRAFELGEASALAPLDYTRILFAGIAGYLVFGDVPDSWMWIGSAVVVASTLYITRREARLGKQAAPPPPIAPSASP